MTGCPECALTPYHERWGEFVDRLAQALAGPRAWATGDLDTIVRAAERGCQHGTFNASRAILATMELDIGASLDAFRFHGVCCDCDCEVLTKTHTEEEER